MGEIFLAENFVTYGYYEIVITQNFLTMAFYVVFLRIHPLSAMGAFKLL